jgi:integrase/recombinase XerD
MEKEIKPQTGLVVDETQQQDLEQRTKEILEETRLLATFLYQKTPHTRRAYESDIKQFFAFYRGKTLKDITSAHIVVYFKNHPDLSEATRARIKSSLSSLFKFCIRQRYLTENPCSSLDPIKVPDQTQFRVLSIEEVKRLVELEANPRNKFFIKLLARTGLRISEAISLTGENFKERDGESFLIVVGKGSKTRTVKVPRTYLMEALSFLKDNEGNSLPLNTPIFRSKNTLKKISVKTGWEIVKKAARKARLSEDVSPHWLRHFHATYSLKMGDDLRVIQKTLGHDSIATTTKYTAVMPGQSSGESIEI